LQDRSSRRRRRRRRRREMRRSCGLTGPKNHFQPGMIERKGVAKEEEEKFSPFSSSNSGEKRKFFHPNISPGREMFEFNKKMWIKMMMNFAMPPIDIIKIRAALISHRHSRGGGY
jgi:hypothetical protein